MPNRIIKESICESETLSGCSVFALDLYKRLITYADDYGRFNSDTTIMRARLYPREYEEVTEEDLIDGLAELAGVGKISFYTPGIFNQFGKKGVYGAFPNWSEHQRVRESKKKCPEPGDTTINDWYLRRFIPMDMKAEILERDDFKCQVCKKFVTSCRDAKRFAKLGLGLYHIDHIVPVQQGGRATMENLRVTCPECNLKRKRKFTFKELLAEACDNSQNVAETCGELLPESRIQNPNPESNTDICASTGTKPKRFTPPTVEDVRAYCQERRNNVDPQRFIDYYSSNGWMVGKNKMKDWKAAVRTWERNSFGKSNAPTQSAENDLADLI